MANWLMELTKLSKTDKTAKELLAQLKAATTDEEKEKAKQNGKEYIQTVQEAATAAVPETAEPTPEPSPEPTTEENELVQKDPVDNSDDTGGLDAGSGPVDAPKSVDKKYDMSEPAFNPRLAKMGITREEELFKLGVYVRKLTRDEKILIRRSIYQKTKGYRAQTQEAFKKKQAEARAARAADPEYQRFLQQQKMVLRIEEALKNHYNFEWMFKNIEGLTVDILRELIRVPANANKFRAQKAEFVQNFNKKFGLTKEQKDV